jgi:threonine synthase
MLYSDGSTALSSAAYSARAGLRSITLVPQGTPDYRLLPLAFYNSTIFEYQGYASDALDWTREACATLNIYETSTYRDVNPYGAEGPKTISYEVVDQLGKAPAWVIVPVGGGGSLCAIWQGFQDLLKSGEIEKCPRLAAVFPTGYTLLESAFHDNVTDESELRALVTKSMPDTIQAKISMAYPPDGLETNRAIRESDGLFFYASDDEVIRGQMQLGREGIFAEPSAAGVMLVVEELAKLGLSEDDAVVAVITGSGFREIGSVAGSIKLQKKQVEPATGIEDIRRWLNE